MSYRCIAVRCEHCARLLCACDDIAVMCCDCGLDPVAAHSDYCVRCQPISVGDAVRERKAPASCQPWRGTVTHVAPDGWVCVRTAYGTMSVPPGEVERDAAEVIR